MSSSNKQTKKQKKRNFTTISPNEISPKSMREKVIYNYRIPFLFMF